MLVYTDLLRHLSNGALGRLIPQINQCSGTQIATTWCPILNRAGEGVFEPNGQPLARAVGIRNRIQVTTFSIANKAGRRTAHAVAHDVTPERNPEGSRDEISGFPRSKMRTPQSTLNFSVVLRKSQLNVFKALDFDQPNLPLAVKLVNDVSSITRIKVLKDPGIYNCALKKNGMVIRCTMRYTNYENTFCGRL